MEAILAILAILLDFAAVILSRNYWHFLYLRVRELFAFFRLPGRGGGGNVAILRPASKGKKLGVGRLLQRPTIIEKGATRRDDDGFNTEGTEGTEDGN